MKKDLFEHHDYKGYLNAFIQSQPNKGRGLRMAIAKAIGSPVSHISQVLSGNSQFTLEQAESVNEYLNHTGEEAQFFLLLVQLARAGTPALKKRINQQIQMILEKRLILKDRLGVKQGISKEDQSSFYSSWIHGAVHVMLTIPKFQTKDAISHHLGVSPKKIGEILEFLVSIGLAVPKSGGRFDIGNSRIHLGSDSPLISKFHTNWRTKAIQSFDADKKEDDLHYSSAVTISEADFLKIKSVLVRNIEEIKAIIKDSPAEGVHCFSIDFFRL